MPGSKVGIVRDAAASTAPNLDATAANLRAHVPALNASLTHATEAADDSNQSDIKNLQDLVTVGAKEVNDCADQVETSARLLREIETEL